MRLSNIKLGSVFLALCLAFVGPSWAADNYTVKDSTGATKTIRAKDVGAGILSTTHTVANSSGTMIDPATSTKQPALGTAGTPSADVITVQGSGSGTPIPVSAASLPLPSGAATAANQVPPKAEDAAHVSGDLGTMTLTVRSDAIGATAGTAGDYQPLITDASGRLWVNCSTGCSGGTQFAEDAVHTTGDVGTVALGIRKDTASALAGADGDYTTSIYDASGRLWVNVGADAVQGATSDTSSSNTMFGALLAIKAAAQDTTTATPSDVTKIGGTTVATGNGVAGAGAQRVTIASDNTAFAVNANLTAATTGGCTPYGLASAATTNATNIKASVGTLCSLSVINTTATLYYLRLYNAASAPTCSSATNFVLTVPIPASATGAGVVVNTGSFGWAFSTGISFCLTGGGSSTDNTSAATGVYLAASYK